MPHKDDQAWFCSACNCWVTAPHVCQGPDDDYDETVAAVLDGLSD